MHIKVHGTNPEEERRYSPAEVVSSEKVPVMGNPEKSRLCTSHVEPKTNDQNANAPHDAPDERIQ